MTIAIDISGLAWKYRTGVQNLVAAYVDAWNNVKETLDEEVCFYDRSGVFNKEISEIAGFYYKSCVPKWTPSLFRRPLQVLITSGLLPANSVKDCINHVWNYRIYNPKTTKASITIPDTLPIEYPQWFSKRFISLTKNSIKFAKNEAQFVFTISSFVKNKIHEYGGISLDRIHVVSPGIDASYFSPMDEAFINQILNKYGLQKQNYVISSGFIDPRKNLCNQIKAFECYVKEGKSDMKYVLTGLKNNLSEEVVNLINSHHLQSQVILLGYVVKDELRALLRASKALLYCSIAEGFGLPLIEAMASETQVITSNTTSMKELGSGRSELADPYSVDSIYECIKNTVNLSSKQRLDLLDRNKRFASNHTINNWFLNHFNVWNGTS